jgi:ligand-binding sensor domain-containing protein
MLKYTILCVLVFIISFTFTGEAQSPHFKSIQLLRSGQPLKIAVISQDSTGYMWVFILPKGLIRYDGVEPVFYNEKDSVDKSPVTCIYTAKDGITWFGHKNGQIEYYQNNQFYKF